jgi:hypothetical protein
MKKSAFPAGLLLIGIGLSGCPVYDGDAGCYDDFDCDYGYLCDGDTGVCYADADAGNPDDTEACRKPSDCGENETCSRFGACSSGDCNYSTVGCVQGYLCTLDAGRYSCIARASNGGAGGESAGQGGQGGEGGQGPAQGGESTGGQGSDGESPAGGQPSAG